MSEIHSANGMQQIISPRLPTPKEIEMFGAALNIAAGQLELSAVIAHGNGSSVMAKTYLTGAANFRGTAQLISEGKIIGSGVIKP